MKITLALSALLSLTLGVPAQAQAVGGAYLNGPAVVSAPIVAQDQVIATGQPPLGAPTGGAAVQGGMGSLPGTGAGATMDAYGNLANPARGGCTSNCR